MINKRLNHFASLLFIFMASCSPALYANATQETEKSFSPLQDYSAEFKLKSERYKLSTKAKRTLKIDENGVATLKQEASVLVASIEQKSVFQTLKTNCLIQSHQYQYERSVFGKKKQYKIQFDYHNNVFFENDDGEKNQANLNGQLFDELSYQESLRCSLKNLAKLNPGKQFSYPVRTKGKNKTYTFEISGTEMLQTKLGNIKTVKLSRIRSSQKENERSEIWFSLEHDFMLVKLLQEDEDDKLSLDITELN